jgi:hypothetical protein
VTLMGVNVSMNYVIKLLFDIKDLSPCGTTVVNNNRLFKFWDVAPCSLVHNDLLLDD